MRARTFARALGSAIGVVVIGMLGAIAFHPDDGSVVHAEALWHVFGTAVYLGALAIPLILLAGLVSLVVHACGRWHARHV